MKTEIERKFLVKGFSWKTTGGKRYCQGYISRNKQSTVRVRISDDKAFLAVKGAQTGITRLEYEYAIPKIDAEELLEHLCEKPLIEKIRYRVSFGGHVFEIDEFLGDNAGLIVAEIELESEDQDFPKPPWLGNEVTRDPRYYNVNLVQHPFKEWV
ncbi:MAG: CYTH domain-containing protein [Desulfobacteraceae bacterium]|nr:MAG: CYTH domain-containing protein [Desulfobacteraceae bacterium]